MKEYIKPFIEEETIEIDDICSASTFDSVNLEDDPNSTDGNGLFFEE